MDKIDNLTEEQKTELLKEIFEYVNQSHAWLSTNTDYAKGYRNGVGVVKHNVQEIFAEHNVLA